MDIAKARILLAAVFVARGTSFLFSKILLQNMSPMSIIGVRFVLSFLILAALFPKKLRDCSRVSLKGGVLLGILYTMCMVFEMFGLLSVTQGESPGGAFGIVLSLFAAVTFACAIIVTGRFSREGDPITIGMIQLGTMGVLCVIAAFAARHPELPKTPEQWVMMLLLVLSALFIYNMGTGAEDPEGTAGKKEQYS